MSSTALVVAGELLNPRALYNLALKLRELSQRNANDRAAEAEYRELLDGITLELGKRFCPDGDESPYEAEDAENAAREYADAYQEASGAPKRKLLHNAFFSYFNPKFYQGGLNRILSKYARQLEYPEAVYLRKLFDHVKAQLGRPSPPTIQSSELHFEWHVTSAPVRKTSLNFEFAQRLERIGLVTLDRLREDRVHVAVAPNLDLVEALLEFVWGEETDV